MQTEQFMCLSGMTDTEHTTSGSNELVGCLASTGTVVHPSSL